jgi:hypothetical protein
MLIGFELILRSVRRCWHELGGWLATTKGLMAATADHFHATVVNNSYPAPNKSIVEPV